jgi:hypothetical protein
MASMEIRICSEEGVAHQKAARTLAGLNSVTIAAEHQHKSHLAFP